MRIVKNNKLEILGSAVLLLIFLLPIFSLGAGNDIHVDADATGEQTGSSKHPYKTISKALKNSDKDTKIHIAAGVYKENIEIPSGVEIFGSSQHEVILEAKDDSREVVKMHHKTEINKVTVRKGKYGVKIDDGDKASVIECRIVDNDKDGIKIEEGPREEKYKASIIESEIKNNGRSGIYSEKRRLVVTDNQIYFNGGDGIDIEAGASAWIANNRIKENKKTGLKIRLDGSDIWTKGNTYHDNDREGIEIIAHGGHGRIDINKSKLYKNDRFGIAKVQKGRFSNSVWSGLTIQDDNIFWDNASGNISHEIVVN